MNNLDGGIHHPFHLHGRPFYLVGRGTGNITEADVPNLVLNTTNPLRRDTLVIGGASWAILRLITDDPGVWGLHCHIGWHLAMGKVSNIDDWADRQLAAIIVQPKKIASMEQPQEWLAVSRMMGNPLIFSSAQATTEANGALLDSASKSVCCNAIEIATEGRDRKKIICTFLQAACSFYSIYVYCYNEPNKPNGNRRSYHPKVSA